MKAIGYKDVPTTVWDAVYEKWETALRDGWDSSLWHGCPLCKHVYGCTLFRKAGRRLNLISTQAICRTCPLYDEWCADSAFASRLNVSFHHPSVPLYSEEAWKERVVEFLKFIKPYTSGGKQ